MGKEANPIPQGKYVPATRFGQLIYTAGMTPRKNGVLMMEGKLGQAANLEDYREAVVQAANRLCQCGGRFHRPVETGGYGIRIFL